MPEKKVKVKVPKNLEDAKCLWAEQKKCYEKLKDLDPNSQEYTMYLNRLKELRSLKAPKEAKKRLDPNVVVKYVTVAGVTLGVAILESPGTFLNVRAAKVVSDVLKIF